MALEPLELKMIEGIQKDVIKIKEILLGNGEIGVLEQIRDLQDGLNSNKVHTLNVDEHAKKAVKDLAAAIDTRFIRLTDTVTPLSKDAQRKKAIKDFAKSAAIFLVTAGPVLLGLVVWAHGFINKVEAMLTVMPK